MQGFNASYPPMNPFMAPQPFAGPFKPLPSQNQVTLYIGDLEEQISEELLYPYFSKFGPIYSLKVMRDRYLRKSRGFGFISYYNQKDAETARNLANHDIILSRPIRVTNYRSPKDTPPGANVFLKDVDKSIKIQEVDKALGVFGKIFSSKISMDENGESRGYGYVQFESEAEAEACLAQNGNVAINGIKLNIERYLPKSGRQNNAVQNNLYVKNLPKVPEGTAEADYVKNLEQELKEKLSQGGKHKIVSFLLKKDDQGRYFSFSCFENNVDADAILNELNSKEITFNCAPGQTEKLYINWAEKKALRMKNLRERKASRANETNLFTKGLKKTTQKEDLETAFLQFGKITSCMVVDSPDTRIDTRQGFINFESKDDARNAFINAKEKPEIRGLYANEVVYINWHLRKEHNRKIKEAKQFRNPMAMAGAPFGFPMSPMPFPMDMNPYMMPMHPGFAGGFRPDYMGYPGRQPRFDQQPGGPSGPRGAGFPGGNQRPYVQRGPAGYQGGAPRGGKQQYGNRQPGGGKYQGNRPQRPNPMGGSGGMVVGAPGNASMEKPLAPNAQIQIPTVAPTNLRENMQEFLKLDTNKQRETLGNMLFPRIKKYADDDLAPKITGMLIDFSVFEVQDIVEFLENEESLKEKIEEARELIRSQENQA